MITPSTTGDPMGSGNPPGEFKEGYLNPGSEPSSYFCEKPSYRADTGRAEKESVVGNQPTKNESTIEKFANQPSL